MPAKTRGEVVYGVTRLPPQAAPSQRLAKIVRQHWGIENGLHYRRDVTFHEDAGRTKNWNLAQAFATIHNSVLALLVYAGDTNLVQARRREDCLALILTGGIIWRIHMWLGVSILTGLAGLGPSLLLVPPSIPRE